MKTKLLHFIRIVIAVAFLGVGAITLFSAWNTDTGYCGTSSVFLPLMAFTLLVCGVFFASGYLLLRRHYWHFATIWIVLAAFGVLGFVLGLSLRAQEILSLSITDRNITLLQIASLFVGFYAARWFIHSAFRLLNLLLPREPHNSVRTA